MITRYILCLFLSALSFPAQVKRDAGTLKNPFAADPQAVDAGKLQFADACAGCHGANAEGGRGPNLVENDRIRRKTDGELFNTIHGGIPAGGMPAFSLPDKSIWQIVAFLRSLSTPAFLVAVAGDERAGSQVYEKAQCGSCHKVAGQGGFLGPDLTDIAASRTVNQLRDALVAPGKKPVPGYTGVTATLKTGRQITGVAKNYSNYSVDILDAQGSLHLLAISDVQDLQFRSKSLMPDTYTKTLSPDELKDLLAYLSRRTVRPDARLDTKKASAEEH